MFIKVSFKNSTHAGQFKVKSIHNELIKISKGLNNFS